jgi:hypothetical protein
MFASSSPHHGRVARAVALVCLSLVIGWVVAPVALARPPIIYGFGDPDDEKIPEPEVANGGYADHSSAEPWWKRSIIFYLVKLHFFGGYCFVCFR